MTERHKYILEICSLLAFSFAAFLFLDTRYAHADLFNKEMKKKVDLSVVQSLQQSIIQDRIYELELKEFKLSKQGSLSDLEQFEFMKTKQRLTALRKQVSPLDAKLN